MPIKRTAKEDIQKGAAEVDPNTIEEAENTQDQQAIDFKRLQTVHNTFYSDYIRQQADIDQSETMHFVAPNSDKNRVSTIFWAASKLIRQNKFDPIYIEFEKFSPFYEAGAFAGNVATFGKMIYRTEIVQNILDSGAAKDYSGYISFIKGIFYNKHESSASRQLRDVLNAAKVDPLEYEAIFYQLLAASFEPVLVDNMFLQPDLDKDGNLLSDKIEVNSVFKYESPELRTRRLPKGNRLNYRQRKAAYDYIIYWAGLWLFHFFSNTREDIISAYISYGHTYTKAATLAWSMVNPYGKKLDTKSVYLPAEVKSHKYMADNVADGMIKTVFGMPSDGQTSLFPFISSYDRKTGKEYTSTIALYWQGDKNIRIGRNLTAPDRTAFNAICTLQKAKYQMMTIKDIYCAAHDIKDTSRKIRQAQLDKLVKSIKKMLSTWLVLDFSEEAQATELKVNGEDVKNGVIEGMLLKADIIDVNLKNGSKVQGLRMASQELPTLYQYCEAKSHILTLPRALMDTSTCLNETDRLPGIKEYLAQRIRGYDKGALNQNKIKYASIYNYLGEPYPSNRMAIARDKETLAKIMAVLTLRNHIKGYHMGADTLEFYLEKDFDTTPPKGMTDKNSKKEYVEKRVKENEHLRKRIEKELSAAFDKNKQAEIIKEWMQNK